MKLFIFLFVKQKTNITYNEEINFSIINARCRNYDDFCTGTD